MRTLPIVAAWGAIGVLVASLVSSKYILDVLVRYEWPVVVYVALLAVIAYAPSVWWCFFVSRRWGTGDIRADLGLSARLADLGWGPVVWLCAIGMQLAIAAIVVGFGIPVSNNTDAITEVQDDRTYVISIVITAVIAAPIVEEMVFRGVVLRGLRSRMPIVAAVLLQGVLFGAAHIDPVRGTGNLGLVMVLSGVGIAFGGAVALIGRVGPAMVAHALFNGVVLLIVLTGVADDLDESRSRSEFFHDVSTSLPGSMVELDVSGGEEVGVVDQADRPDPGGDGDAHRAWSTAPRIELVDRREVVGVEQRDVVDGRQILLVENPPSGVDD
jgi:membrane protease YdiL (CAAX protease family)